MPGVAGVDVDLQLAEARAWFAPEFCAALEETDLHADACRENGADGYGPMEAQFLHAFRSHTSPASRRPGRCGCHDRGHPGCSQASRRRPQDHRKRPVSDIAPGAARIRRIDQATAQPGTDRRDGEVHQPPRGRSLAGRQHTHGQGRQRGQQAGPRRFPTAQTWSRRACARHHGPVRLPAGHTRRPVVLLEREHPATCLPH